MSNPQVLDAILRSSFPLFVRKVFQTLNPGKDYLENWHIDAIAHHLDEVRSGDLTRLMITMPPRSLKSICTSIALPAFLLGHDPAKQIIGVSYTQELANKLSRDFRKILESDWYKRIFPQVTVTKDTEALIETSVGGGRFSTSIGGALTGFGGNLIIIDDPLNGDDAMSEAARKNVREFYNSTLLSRLDNPAKDAIIIVMQRLHEGDLIGHLLETEPEFWTELRLSAIAEEDETIPIGADMFHKRKAGDLLHAERLSQTVLDQRRRSIGSANFAAQYQQTPVPAGGAMLQRKWLKSYTRAPDRAFGKVIQSWDTAMKGNVGADYSVCTTWLDVEGNHYLLDVLRERLEFPNLLKRAIEQYNRYQPEGVLIEDRVSGISLSQQLRQCSRMPVLDRKPEGDKLVRYDRVMPLFESGRVFFPENAPWLAELLKELLGFPASRYDDQVDSVSQYLGWAIERNVQGTFECTWFFDDADPTPDDVAHRRLHRPVLGVPGMFD